MSNTSRNPNSKGQLFVNIDPDKIDSVVRYAYESANISYTGPGQPIAGETAASYLGELARAAEFQSLPYCEHIRDFHHEELRRQTPIVTSGAIPHLPPINQTELKNMVYQLDKALNVMRDRIFSHDLLVDIGGNQHTTTIKNKEDRKQRGRKRKHEKDSDQLVIAALAKHHQYDSGSVLNYEPATNRGLAKNYKLSNNALSRFFEDKGGIDEYRHWCINQTIGIKIAVWRGELDQHLHLRPEEYGRRAED